MWHRDIKNKTICCAPMNIPHDTSCPGDVDPRDHGKARKFKKMSDAGAVPEHILDLINEQSKKSNQPRQAKTALINKLFEKNGKGGYDMVINKPVCTRRAGATAMARTSAKAPPKMSSMEQQRPWKQPFAMARSCSMIREVQLSAASEGQLLE